ncbi:MAG: glycoside hydrolase family 28 protein [Lachnospiraceae bacterium]|nr:glycoside hydrolase family 28 protein [Lachnospiraceae bacterium]MBQ8948043.1 glycoside hydrolase family 28 protein [Lachnospiraceae bacterium]
MKLNIIDTEPHQITIELENDTCYTAPSKVSAKARCIASQTPGVRSSEREYEFTTNVFTIDGLSPDTTYSLELQDESGDIGNGSFTTSKESVLLDVRRFGAKGDGETRDTSAIQAAIMACPPEGTVYLGSGTYLCGPLFIKSNMSIWLDEDAVILGSTDRGDYPVLPGMVYSTDEKEDYNFGSWEGNPLDCHASLITGIEVENVRIYGRGKLDGNAQNGDWWVNPKIRRDAWRPRTVFLNRCKNIKLVGITVCNTPCWTIHPYYCDNVDLIGLTIRNPSDSPNTDGIDPESCVNLNVIGTDISVGDDCIAIKSGKIYMARKHYRRTSGLIVRNCRLNRGHGSVTVGSECAGGVENVHVSQCIFDSTDRGLRIKTRRGRGSRSVLEDIVFDSIRMINVRMPFTVNMFYFCDPDGHSEYVQTKEPQPVDELTPEIRSIIARNITCEGVDAALLTVYGLPEKKVGEVVLENIEADFLPEEKRVPAVPVMMDGMEPMSGRGIFVRNVEKLTLNNVNIRGSVDTEPDIG